MVICVIARESHLRSITPGFRAWLGARWCLPCNAREPP